MIGKLLKNPFWTAVLVVLVLHFTGVYTFDDLSQDIANWLADATGGILTLYAPELLMYVPV